MKIIFVYNANSGFTNSVMNIAHKLISPSTYSCALCTITHGIFQENKRWKSYREQSKHQFEFLHKDEFEKTYRLNYDYPVILKLVDKKFTILKDKLDVGKMKSTEDFITFLETV